MKKDLSSIKKHKGLHVALSVGIRGGTFNLRGLIFRQGVFCECREIRVSVGEKKE